MTKELPVFTTRKFSLSLSVFLWWVALVFVVTGGGKEGVENVLAKIDPGQATP